MYCNTSEKYGTFNRKHRVHENSKLKPEENMLCTEIVSDIQQFFKHHVFPYVLQKEEPLTKIYLPVPQSIHQHHGKNLERGSFKQVSTLGDAKSLAKKWAKEIHR